MFYYRFPAARSRFQITGQVDSSGGGQVSGATVTVNPGDRVATTNGSGIYTIRNLPSGSYTIGSTKALFDNYSSSFDITGKNLTKDFVMTLTVIPTYSVSGTVSSSNGGQVLDGVTVSLGAFNAVTDISGNYTITGVTAGSHAWSGSRTLYTTNNLGNLNVSANMTGQNFTLTPTVTAAQRLLFTTVTPVSVGSGPGYSFAVGVLFLPQVNIRLKKLGVNSGGGFSNTHVSIADTHGSQPPHLADVVTFSGFVANTWTYQVPDGGEVTLNSGQKYCVTMDATYNGTLNISTESNPGFGGVGVAIAENPPHLTAAAGQLNRVPGPGAYNGSYPAVGLCDIEYLL